MTDDQTVSIRESGDGFYVAHATSSRTGETWHVVTRDSRLVGEAVAAAFVGEVMGAWDGVTCMWTIGYGKDAGETIARFQTAEQARGEMLRAEPDTDEFYEAKWRMEDALR